MLKKCLICFTMIGVVVLALASNGGGDKKKTSTTKPDFIPVRTVNGFTLEAGPTYYGSRVYNSSRQNNFVMYNSVVTYRKGNTIYILPTNYKMNTKPTFRSNLYALDLKIKLNK